MQHVINCATDDNLVQYHSAHLVCIDMHVELHVH